MLRSVRALSPLTAVAPMELFPKQRATRLGWALCLANTPLVLLQLSGAERISGNDVGPR